MELVVHLGLPKTMTTSLQRGSIWPTWPEVAKLSGRYLAENLYFDGKSERGLRSWHGRKWRVDTRKWARLIRPMIGERYVISNENLSQWPTGPYCVWPLQDGSCLRTGSHPISAFLLALRQPLESQGIGLKAIIGMRDRATFLASLYAELSHSFEKPSSQDFIQRASRYDPFLEFNRLRKDLADALGPQNLFVYDFEKGMDELLQRLYLFLGVEAAPLTPTAERQIIRKQSVDFENRGCIRPNRGDEKHD